MLDQFLDDQSRLPFVLGGPKDCILQPADWIVRLGLADPASEYRGRYRTELGWRRLVTRAGGLDAVVGRGLERVGMKRTGAPVRGDVGLIVLPDGRTVGAICTGRLWVVASHAGSVAVRANPVCAWSAYG